ncbi:fatty acid-binding protein-like [Aphomia sociella]
MEHLGKKYKLKSSDNFDDYMKALGIGLLSRKAAASMTPVCELVKNDDGTLAYISCSSLKNMKYVFKLGEQVVTERADGVKVNSTFTIEGDTLTQVEVEDSGKTSKHVRTFSDDSLVAVSTLDGWSGNCTRIYERVR